MPRATRRTILTAPALVASARLAVASEYPGARYRDYSRCLPEFVGALAAQAYRRREGALAALTTADDVRRRQRWARETFWRLAGGEPARTPLHLRTVGALDRPGYRLEKLLYESQPGLHVTANLYLPTIGEPPFPAVLFQMGHAAEGKAFATYQRCCQGLARLGHVVLAFDPMGQGERAYRLDGSGRRSRLGAEGEHDDAGRPMLLIGDSATRMQVWDAVRSLDVLASHPLVDARRLASTGTSGGGTLTMFLCAVDDRLAAAAPSCPNVENMAVADFIPPGATDDAEQNLPGAGPLGFDRWDALWPFAPQPLLVCVSDRDFLGTYSARYVSNGREELGKLRAAYQRLGHGDRLAWGGTALPHALGYDVRLQIYSWFARWLRGDAAPVEHEPPTEPEPEESLWCTEGGSVTRALRGATPASLARARLPRRRTGGWAALVGADRPPATGATVLRRMPSETGTIAALEIPSAAGVWLPAWLYRPGPATAVRSAIVLVPQGGRLTQWQSGGLFERLAQMGHTVLVPDVRGVGDLVPELGRSSPRAARAHADEDSWSWASLVFGKPLVGQRVTDILAAVATARREHATVLVAAQGKLTVPALMAAALDRGLARLYLSGGLVSFASLLETDAHAHPFANFVPRLLERTDLPELARTLAPIEVVLAGALDGAGEPMSAGDVRARHQDAHNVRVVADPGWTAEAISAAAAPAV